MKWKGLYSIRHAHDRKYPVHISIYLRCIHIYRATEKDHYLHSSKHTVPGGDFRECKNPAPIVRITDDQGTDLNLMDLLHRFLPALCLYLLPSHLHTALDSALSHRCHGIEQLKIVSAHSPFDHLAFCPFPSPEGEHFYESVRSNGLHIN